MSRPRCPYCGEQVMPYRRFALHLRQSAVCEACGRAVAVRGFHASVLFGLVVGGLMVWLWARSPDPSAGYLLAVAGCTGAIAFAADWAMWRWVGFRRVDEPAAPAGTEASRSP